MSILKTTIRPFAPLWQAIARKQEKSCIIKPFRVYPLASYNRLFSAVLFLVRMRSAVRICPAAPKKQIPEWVSAFFARWADSNHVRRPHRWPASTSANTGRYLYSVFPSPARENRMQTNTAQQLRASSLPHSYQGGASFSSKLPPEGSYDPAGGYFLPIKIQPRQGMPCRCITVSLYYPIRERGSG